MGTNVIVFAWNRSIPGRERLSAEHFDEFVRFLSAQQKKGAIQSFDTVILDPHGGDMNGFFLIRAENSKLDALVSGTDWENHVARAASHLQGSGAIRGVTGDLVMERMNLWTKNIPA